jgi:hypothetical protein
MPAADDRNTQALASENQKLQALLKDTQEELEILRQENENLNKVRICQLLTASLTAQVVVSMNQRLSRLTARQSTASS